MKKLLAQYKFVTLIYLCVLLILYVWMFVIRNFILDTNYPEYQNILYKGISIEANPWLEPWQRWDTPQYQAIAERGYLAFDLALFTPPLYPLLIGVLANIHTNNSLSAALILSMVFSYATLISFFNFAHDQLGNNAEALRATLYFSIFPTSFFLFAGYTESLFLFSVISSLYFAQKEKWLLAGALGGIATLSRSPGILIVIPLSYAATCKWRQGKRITPFVAPIFAIAMSTFFPIYAWISIKATIFDIAYAVGRGGYLTIPGLNIFQSFRRIVTNQLPIENLFELSFTLLFVVLTVLVWIKLPRIYGLYSATMILFFLSRMGDPQPLVSMARYVLEIYPAFVILALWGRNPKIHRVIFYCSAIGLLFMAGQFAIWGWIG